MLHGILATLKFRSYGVAIFRETLIIYFGEILKSQSFNLRDFIRNIVNSSECSYRIFACVQVSNNKSLNMTYHFNYFKDAFLWEDLDQDF